MSVIAVIPHTLLFAGQTMVAQCEKIRIMTMSEKVEYHDYTNRCNCHLHHPCPNFDKRTHYVLTNPQIPIADIKSELANSFSMMSPIWEVK